MIRLSKIRMFALALPLAFGGLTLVGCQDGAMEDFGEEIDDAADDAGDAIDDAADDVEDSVD
ncbi:MAG: hypothetical protein R3F62_27025 [Planctomycetota bacterium]